MDVITIASMLVELFEAQAVVGLLLLAIVIVVVAREVLAERHRSDGHPR